MANANTWGKPGHGNGPFRLDGAEKFAERLRNPTASPLSTASKFSLGGAALMVAPDVYMKMQGGDSLSTAIVRSIPEAVAWSVAPGIMWSVTGAQLAPMVAAGYARADQTLRGKYNTNRRPGTNFSYMDTQQAVTMRQAAVQAIQGSKLNARNALGGEASMMHRGYGNRMGTDW